jgi:CheY-like chemotaxis protein
MECNKKNLNVLLIEDNIIYAACISSLLDKHKINHSIAQNGKDGLELFIESCLNNQKYDIIFSKIDTSILNGNELASKIREYEKNNNLKNTNIYAIVKNSENIFNLECLDYGFNDYIEREYVILDILRIIQKYQITNSSNIFQKKKNITYDSLIKKEKKIKEKPYQKRHNWIIEKLKKDKTIKSIDIVNEYNINRDTACRDLKILLDKGSIIKKGTGSYVYYELKQ